MPKETNELALLRWKKHALVQEHYSEFIPFLRDMMDLIGFETSELQEDIGKFIAYGPDALMVQAQRGQAKTTIAAAVAVWHLIQTPNGKVLILSAGGSLASDISTLITRVINSMPELEHMRPDTNNGDRSSVEHYDIHYTLKGVDKSPSVKCLGITANLQGSRATLLLADDIESLKNSSTNTQREQLWQKVIDLPSLIVDGRIVWLGTPQSKDSIYNRLPSHGVVVRIWPGRYPSVKQEEDYGGHLAPYLKRKLEANPGLRTGGGPDGTQGQVTENVPGYLDEAALQTKELRQGPSWFQLQHMLSTRLADAMRHPLKAHFMGMLNLSDKGPEILYRGPDPSKYHQKSSAGHAFRLANVQGVSERLLEWDATVAYLDPAGGGQNADETGLAVVSLLNGNLFLRQAGGLPGGFEPSTLKQLAERVARLNPSTLVIEKNFGYGAFFHVFMPYLREKWQGNVEEDLVTGQKETRIIRTLEPIMARGALFIDEAVVLQDENDCDRYSPQDRMGYSLFFQLERLTRDRGSLRHDDRLDALEGACRILMAGVSQDQEAQKAKREEDARLAWMANPMMKDSHEIPGRKGSVLQRVWRRR